MKVQVKTNEVVSSNNLVTMTKTETFDSTKIKGYQETSIDALKHTKNRLICCSDGYYTIDLINGERLTLKGKRAFDKWTKSNDYMTDF